MKKYLQLLLVIAAVFTMLAWLMPGPAPSTVMHLTGMNGLPGISSLAGQLFLQPTLHQPLAVQPGEVLQQGPDGDKLVLGGVFTLASGERLEGSLIILGGVANLEEGSVVKEDVVVIGGTTTVNGEVKGDISAVGGLVSLGSTAVVGGDVNSLAGHLDRDEGARIEGEVNTEMTGPFSLIIPGRIQIPGLENLPPITLPRDVQPPVVNVRFNPLWDGLWWLVRSFIWAALAVLIALFAPIRTERIAASVVKNPIASGGMGCLTTLVAPVVLILMAITICGIPFAFLGAVVLWVAWVFGIIVFGAEVGKRLATLFNSDWAVPVSAGVGAFVLTLVLNGIGVLVPCVGWVPSALVGLAGFGAVLLTRFGGRDYPYDEPESDGSRLESLLPDDPVPDAHLGVEDSTHIDPEPDSLPLPGEPGEDPGEV